MITSCKSCKTKIDVDRITSDLIGRTVKGVVSPISGRVFAKGTPLCWHCIGKCRRCDEADETAKSTQKTVWWNPVDFLEDSE